MSFPNRTMCRFHKGHCVVSKQDNVRFPNRTMQTGQCVVSKHDNTKQFDVAETTAPKPPRRNLHAETSRRKRPRPSVYTETSTPKRPRRNAHDEEFSGRNIFRWSYVLSYWCHYCIVSCIASDLPLPIVKAMTGIMDGSYTVLHRNRILFYYLVIGGLRPPITTWKSPGPQIIPIN